MHTHGQHDNNNEQQSLGEFFEEKITKAPWWMISIVFHVIVAVIATLIVYHQAPPQPEFEYTVEIQLEKYKQTKPEPKKPFLTKPKYSRVYENIEKEHSVREAQIADNQQTQDAEDFHMAKGQQAATHNPFHKVPNDSFVGTGQAAGGTFGTRFGGKNDLVQQGGGDSATENAVEAGLKWLKRHQSTNGSWDTDGYRSKCNSDPSYVGCCNGDGHAQYDVAMTSLALLCFLGAGHTSTVGNYQQQVKKGVHYLIQSQDSEGCIGDRQLPRHMYNHAIATMALSETYALSNHNPRYKIATQKAIQFLLKAQTPGGGWRYTFRRGDDDTSVMGWCIMALRAARLAGIEIPESTFDGARDFLSQVTSPEYRVGYRQKSGNIEFENSVMTTKPLFQLPNQFRQTLTKNVVSSDLQNIFRRNGHTISSYATLQQKHFTGIASALGSSVAKSQNTSWVLNDTHNNKQYIIDGEQLAVSYVTDIFAKSEAMTAVAMTARVFMKSQRNEPHFEGGAQWLLQNLPTWEQNSQGHNQVNYYYWYYGTLAMFQMGKDYWPQWNDRLKKVLVDRQQQSGCENGSWPPVGKRCGAGGRIYATTLSILSLEIYYRYAKIFQ
ncbi:prenyltransferase/squalene oxidase repeat-containing protein [Candidatus Uabimicrobium amorphum]|uniref:Uncharacterized protein n=1 Tax=Uabimicrobium amorphum TaxID=2596890 RepID=A0A5S9F764_UABAM|nr:prenyltransferase/squalene oxidase repeat-containing protein [Candidatus Uabimicrobium amorphum]BBM87304.1 hypothetical protein UABAM_05713 [Candidatus Uabimicrobium amorphum]